MSSGAPELPERPEAASLPAASNGASGDRVSVWSDVSGLRGDDPALLSQLLFTPIDFLVARPEQLEDVQVPERVTVGCVINGDLDRAASHGELLVASDVAQAREARAAGRSVALRVVVADRDSLDAARAAAREADYLLVRFSDPTNIPLELLIAESQGTSTRIVKEVGSAEDAVVSMGVLESGPSGVLFELDDVARIGELERCLKQSRESRLPLTEATVTGVRPVGTGFRACVDTVSLFGADEGMLVGSTSAGGLVVCAEVHHLPYMNLRPFRVNAGAVHSYIWGAELTEYLTDLRPGSELLAVSTEGVTRPVTVGRTKTEVRSLRLIEAEAEGTELNLFVQDDWHVRIFAADGSPANCSEIEVGDKLLAHVCAPGRHVGIAIEETIEEQ